MPTIFSFQQGSESSHLRYTADASPLLGRFRAVPRPEHASQRRSGPSISSDGRARRGLLSAGWRGSVHVGYGTLLSTELGDEDEDDYDDDEDDGDDDDEDGSHVYYEKSRLARLVWWARRLARKTEDTWVTPRASAVKRVVDQWWSRWAVLVVLPASLVSTPEAPMNRLVFVCGGYQGDLMLLILVPGRLLLGVRYHSRNIRCPTTMGRAIPCKIADTKHPVTERQGCK